MSKAEILRELPKLNAAELREIHDRILELEEEDLVSGQATPSEEEKALLDRELEDYSLDPDAGSSWEEVESRLKQ
jgi:putative addiction module component (TIGR02574 family)